MPRGIGSLYMNPEEKNETRRWVRKAVLWSTVFFFIVLAGALSLWRITPLWRLDRAERLIARGETQQAREVIARLDDEARAEALYAQCDYIDAAAFFSRGEFAQAREAFARAGAWSDAQEKVKECDYRLAEELAAAGDYDGAIRGFSALGGYADAAERALSCRYDKALSLLSSGEKALAGELFAALGDYADSPEQLAHIAAEVTGIDDPDAALLAFQGRDSAAWEHILTLEKVRESLPAGIVDVGFYHTVGLSREGTVLCCGSNDEGQCALSGTSGAAAVAAGAYHTVALMADGTVKASGRNDEGQCDTSKWKKVVAVAAADYATFGLTAEGRLLCAGFYDYSEPRSWADLDAVWGGSYNLAARRRDGTVWTFPELAGWEELSGAAALAVNTGYAAALMPDGHVICPAFDLSGWTDITAVSGSGTAILALDANGRVHGYFFRPGDAVELSGFHDVTAVAAGGTHHALVFADGSVKVLGQTDRGQGDTGGWVLAVDR